MASIALAAGNIGMDVADRISEILMSPCAFLVIVDLQRFAAFRAMTCIAYEPQMEMNGLDAFVDSSFG